MIENTVTSNYSLSLPDNLRNYVNERVLFPQREKIIKNTIKNLNKGMYGRFGALYVDGMVPTIMDMYINQYSAPNNRDNIAPSCACPCNNLFYTVPRMKKCKRSKVKSHLRNC